jgi:hypothetical protein
MAEQFENVQDTRVEDETTSKTTADKRIDRVAEKAAEKSTKTVQHHEESQKIFRI